MARDAEKSRIWNGYRYRDAERLGRNSFQSFMILKEKKQTAVVQERMGLTFNRRDLG